jgi:hypothetical protein
MIPAPALVALTAFVIAALMILRLAAALLLDERHPMRRFFDRLDGTRNVTRTWTGYEPPTADERRAMRRDRG